MNARNIRRAQERKARKQAIKAEKQGPANQTAASKESKNQSAAEPICQHLTPTGAASNHHAEELDWLTAEEELKTARASSLSQAKREANRANSQFSTGPRTQAGRAKSSRNALKTGLTGKTVLLSQDNAEHYQFHVTRFFQLFHPATERESELVQGLADTQWRLNRIPTLEMGVYALAEIELAEQYEDFEPAQAKALIQTEAYIKYNKQINNLYLQENRLRRQYQNDHKELLKLINERQTREQTEASGQKRTTTATRPFIPSPIDDYSDYPELGFEFSTAISHPANHAADTEIDSQAAA